MSYLLPVADWASDQQCRNIDVLTGKLSNEVFPRSGEVAGFYYVHPKHGNIACFIDDTSRKVVVKNHIVDLNSSRTTADISLRWPFIRLVLAHQDFSIEFRDAAPIGLMLARVDPAFDFMDWSTRYFSCYLYEQYSLAQERAFE